MKSQSEKLNLIITYEAQEYEPIECNSGDTIEKILIHLYISISSSKLFFNSEYVNKITAIIKITAEYIKSKLPIIPPKSTYNKNTSRSLMFYYTLFFDLLTDYCFNSVIPCYNNALYYRFLYLSERQIRWKKKNWQSMGVSL